MIPTKVRHPHQQRVPALSNLGAADAAQQTMLLGMK
jgi:hypothetical protein